MKAEDLATVLGDLQQRGRISLTKATGPGRSASVWRLNERNELNKKGGLNSFLSFLS